MPSTLGIGLAALFLLFLPGLVGLKAFLYTFVKLDNLDRIDKLALGLVLGGLILGGSLFILNWRCWIGNTGSFMSQVHTPDYSSWNGSTQWCNGSGAVTTNLLNSTPIIILIGFVALESAASAIIFGVSGAILNWVTSGPPRQSKYTEQPWEFASKKTIRESEPGTVITASGDEIRGIIHRIGAPSEDYDILLKDPEKVIRDNQDRVKRTREDIGSYSYHHYRDISQIYFHTLGDDPGLDDDGPDEDTTPSSPSDDESDEDEPESRERGVQGKVSLYIPDENDSAEEG